jgi:hypothetical protein
MNFPVLLLTVLLTAAGSGADSEFFPPGPLIFDEADDLDAVARSISAQCILSSGESSLWGTERPANTTIFRAFGPHRDEIALLQLTLPQDELGLLACHRFTGDGNCHEASATHLWVTTSRDVDLEQVRRFGQMFKAAAFWELPRLDSVHCQDGGIWLFEALESKQYHLISRRCSMEEDIESLLRWFTELCELE